MVYRHGTLSLTTTARLLILIVWIAQSEQQSRHSFNGAHLRLSGHQQPPFQYWTKTENGSYIAMGTVVEFFNSLCAQFNMTYTIVRSNNTAIEKLGETGAVIDLLMREEIDVITYGLVPTLERSRFMDFTFPVNIESYRLVQPLPEEESPIMAVFRPFQPKALIMAVVMILTVSCFLVTLALCHRNINLNTDEANLEDNTMTPTQYRPNTRFLQSWKTTFYSILLILTLQKINFSHFQQLSIRTLASVWCLSTVMLVTAYSTTLISYLLVPQKKPMVQSLEDLANSHDLSLATMSNTILTNQFLDATSGVYKTLGDTLRQHHDRLMKSYGEIYTKLDTMKHAVPVTETETKIILRTYYKKENRCQMTASQRLQFAMPMSFALKKNSPHTNTFNYIFMRILETGVVQHWLKYNKEVDKCLAAQRDEEPEYGVINLKHLSGAVLLLAIGILASILCFVGEIAHHKIDASRRAVIVV